MSIVKEFKLWQKIIYIIGWIGGAINIIFWLIALWIHSKEDKFFSDRFHKFVYWWGVIRLIFLPILFFLGFIILLK